MALADKIAEKAKEAMLNDAVIISAADFNAGKITKLQVYFWDEHEAAMDVIKRDDLLDSCPENIYVIDINAKSERELLQEVLVQEIEDELYLKIEKSTTENLAQDDLGNIINVAYMEAIEAIASLKD